MFVHKTHRISTCTLLARRCTDSDSDRNIHAVNLWTYRRPDVGFGEDSQFYGGKEEEIVLFTAVAGLIMCGCHSTLHKSC